MGQARGIIALLALLAAGCASTSPSNPGVACAAPVSVNHALTLRDTPCTTPFEQLLHTLDDGDSTTQEQIALRLDDAGEYTYAAQWYQRADTLSGYQRLLALYAPTGPLADDAAYLRSAIQYAQLQQRFGQAVDYPAPGQAEPLFVQTDAAFLQAEPDTASDVVEILDKDERVYLLDVVLLEERGEYWAEVYYPLTLQLGWLTVDTLEQSPSRVRQELAFFNAENQYQHSQQALFAAVVAAMDLSRLQPLGDSDFFAGAGIQQQNTQALLQGLSAATNRCEADRDTLQQALRYYLMDEGPRPDSGWYPELTIMLNALRQPSAQLQNDVYTYFRIRVRGGVDQRLCHSLPNAAGQPALAEPACQTLIQFNRCLGQASAAFQYLAD